MLVVADASPLHYLVLIAAPDFLPLLFGRVVVPRVVAQELQHPQTPALVRLWMAAPLGWISTRWATTRDASLAHLDPGEQAAITLAQALHAE